VRVCGCVQGAMEPQRTAILDCRNFCGFPWISQSPRNGHRNHPALCGRSSCKWAAWARVGMRRARIRTNTSCIGKPWGALGCTKPRANSLLSPSSPQGRSAQGQKVHKCAGADIRIALFSYSPCLESHSDRRNGKIGARGPICPLRLSECDSKQGEQENRVIRVQGW
jgi:hypothetical protein